MYLPTATYPTAPLPAYSAALLKNGMFLGENIFSSPNFQLDWVELGYQTISRSRVMQNG